MSTVVFPHQIDHSQPLGSFQNPVLDKINPKKQLVAEYLGFKLKYQKYHKDYDYEKREKIDEWRGEPVFKKGVHKCWFTQWDWNHIFDLLELMAKNGHYTDKIKESLVALDQDATFAAVIETLTTVKNQNDGLQSEPSRNHGLH